MTAESHADPTATHLPLNAIDSVDTVFLDETDPAGPRVGIIDQTLLPHELVVERLASLNEVRRAIERLEVRGAPAIGVAAAFGAYMGAWQLVHGVEKPAGSQDAGGAGGDAGASGTGAACRIASAGASATVGAGAGGVAGEIAGACADAGASGVAGFLACFEDSCAFLNAARPTAVNLSWALRKMVGAARRAAAEVASRPIDARDALDRIIAALRTEAIELRDEDVRTCRAIGEHGFALLEELGAGRGGDPFGILTHCNAGRLATVRYGTATAPMYVGHERGAALHVYCDETRPLLQGARLTAFELAAAGIATTLACDNMSASLMRQGLVRAVLVGCDRVAANGDTANKIGTSMVALAARRYGVPFYVCAPTSTIDPATATGGDIVIEERSSEEVTDLWYARRMAPVGIDVRNPAFDVTDADLITAFITENGVVRPPFA